MTNWTTTAVTFAREPLSTALLDEMRPLYEAHSTELSEDADIPLDPDWPLYAEMDVAGLLRVFTVRGPVYALPPGAIPTPEIVSQKLIGYAVFVVRPHPHYRSSLQANQDVLFLHPEYRHMTIGVQLVAFCDAALAADGVQKVFQHVKRAHPALGYIAEQAGYHPIETIYAKRLNLPVDGKTS